MDDGLLSVLVVARITESRNLVGELERLLSLPRVIGFHSIMATIAPVRRRVNILVREQCGMALRCNAGISTLFGRIHGKGTHPAQRE